jgi:hypothetical protein
MAMVIFGCFLLQSILQANGESADLRSSIAEAMESASGSEIFPFKPRPCILLDQTCSVRGYSCCNATAICLGGVCTFDRLALNDNCTRRVECGDGLTCLNNVCSLPLPDGSTCKKLDDCQSLCRNGVCRLGEHGEICSNNDQCKSGTTCFGRKCRSSDICKTCGLTRQCASPFFPPMESAPAPSMCCEGTQCDASTNQCVLTGNPSQYRMVADFLSTPTECVLVGQLRPTSAPGATRAPGSQFFIIDDPSIAEGLNARITSVLTLFIALMLAVL